MSFWKKRVIERDPATLDLDTLCALQGVLVSKLITINEELGRRWQRLAELSEGVPNSDASRAVLAKGAERVSRFNAFLELELAEITRAVPG